MPTIIEACKSYIQQVLQDRDESHGVVHSFKVYFNAIQIWDNYNGAEDYAQTVDDEFTISSSPRILVAISALLHDVCDNKYGNSLEISMNSFLSVHFIEEDAKHIKRIIECISFTSEKEGLFNRRELSPKLRMLRDIVS